MGVLAVLVFVLTPRPVQPGTVVVELASRGGDQLAPVRLQVGSAAVSVGGAAPKAPDSRTAVQLTMAPGTYPIRMGGAQLVDPVSVGSGGTAVVLLAVSGGHVSPNAVYVGVENVNLGLQELSGHMTPMSDFHLVDQNGRSLDRASLLGRDTVIAAFHTNCRQSCPLYTGVLFQVHRSAPSVRVLEVTTDPTTDTPATLAAYRSRIGASWTFATGQAADVAEFWAPFGETLSSGDTHTSELALVDRYGYIRAAWTGVPDVGGRLPSALAQQLDASGRQLLAGHGEGWGAPQVLDNLHTLAVAGRSSDGGRAPTFSLETLDGQRYSLEQALGKPVLLNFGWAGCSACQEELPVLRQYAASHPGVSVLLVDPVDNPGVARSFVGSAHLQSTVLLDTSGQVAAAYRVAAYPTTFFLAGDGIIVSSYAGTLTPDVLASHTSNLGAY